MWKVELASVLHVVPPHVKASDLTENPENLTPYPL